MHRRGGCRRGEDTSFVLLHRSAAVRFHHHLLIRESQFGSPRGEVVVSIDSTPARRDKDDEVLGITALGDLGGRLYVRRSGTLLSPPSTFMICLQVLTFLFRTLPVPASLLFPLGSTLYVTQPLRKRELLFTQRKSKYNARRTHVESLWGRRINKTGGHENVERFLSIATSTTSTSTLADASTSTTDAATTSTTQADTTSAPTTTEAASTSTTEATPKTTSATKAASTSTTEATPTTSTTEDVSASTTETPKTSTVETTESTTFPPTKATTTVSLNV